MTKKGQARYYAGLVWASIPAVSSWIWRIPLHPFPSQDFTSFLLSLSGCSLSLRGGNTDSPLPPRVRTQHLQSLILRVMTSYVSIYKLPMASEASVLHRTMDINTNTQTATLTPRPCSKRIAVGSLLGNPVYNARFGVLLWSEPKTQSCWHMA